MEPLHFATGLHAAADIRGILLRLYYKAQLQVPFRKTSPIIKLEVIKDNADPNEYSIHSNVDKERIKACVKIQRYVIWSQQCHQDKVQELIVKWC